MAAGFALLGTGCSPSGNDDAAASASDPIDPLAAMRWEARSAEVSPGIAGDLIAGGNGTWSCASCHGAKGEGTEQIPALAGLPAGYIAKQLADFATGRRKNASMNYVARGLSEKEMAALGRFYAEMSLEAPAGASLGGDMDRGRELALRGDWRVSAPACYSCHGSSGWGVGPSFPPIAGQQPVYLYQQLTAFATGRRDNDPENFMHDVARVLSDADRRALADYLASRPPRQELTSPAGSRSEQTDATTNPAQTEGDG
ncbi:c-type cytochrome [Guyparkeria sp. SCN-R1]|uniref:c-type cytochrome n=1 Tax=Guyparkeria sp. SCN-R1 TaxID=2341113 RepID=UPI0013155E95|nr:c-type cytochrome [Guyparkeria sp. SCN-R1]